MVGPLTGGYIHEVPIRPPAYQPQLGWYSHAWRLLVCLLVSLQSWSDEWQGQWQDHRPLFWISLGVGLVAFGLSFLRRRWPFPVALVLVAFSSISAFAVGPALLAAVSFATKREIGRIIALGVLWVLASQVYANTQPVPGRGTISVTYRNGQDSRAAPIYADLVAGMVLTSAILGWGMYIGSRRELLWTLRERARQAEAERDLRVASARTIERAAIAGEMHDVLAHRISLVSMQAAAMVFRGDLTAGQLRRESQVIQEQANAALTELRDVLGILRRPMNGEHAGRPQPTYADLDALVGEARESGMHIEFQDLIDPGTAVPDGAGRTVYRIVQEGLTNARKHAPGAMVRIEVSGSPEEGIDVRLRNALGFSRTPAVPGSGLGLIGLAERAGVRGGRLQHGREGSTFVLHGWIPWAA